LLRQKIKEFFTNEKYGLDTQFKIDEIKYNSITNNGFNFLKGSGGLKIQAIFFAQDFNKIFEVLQGDNANLAVKWEPAADVETGPREMKELT